MADTMLSRHTRMADRHDAIVPSKASQLKKKTPYTGTANSMLSSASARANVSVPGAPLRFRRRVAEVSHTNW